VLATLPIRCRYFLKYPCPVSTCVTLYVKENPQPLTRKIMLEKLMQKLSRIYLKGLRTDIGRMIIPRKPTTLIEAEKGAGDIDRYLREEQQRQV
jgi:hypothetical protein